MERIGKNLKLLGSLKVQMNKIKEIKYNINATITCLKKRSRCKFKQKEVFFGGLLNDDGTKWHEKK